MPVKRILLVDDEPELLKAMRIRLASWGYDVLTATNGKEAIQLVKKKVPDAVILDIMMPEMDGWEVYKQMRADNALKNIPVIILTARNSSFEEIIARERAGVNDYVTKPFVPNDLRNSLARILGHTTS